MSHLHQHVNLEFLEMLNGFVCAHKAYVNVQQGRLEVELVSLAEADRFRTLLKGTKHIFVLSIKLRWKAIRPYVRELCLDIARTVTVVLELDGITPDICPQSSETHMHNLFDTEILRNTKLQLITLINYPRLQEQYIQIRRFSFQSMISPVQLLSSWVELKSDLDGTHTALLPLINHP